MERLTRTEFESRFTRRPPIVDLDGLYLCDLHVDKDATISGAVEGSLYVHGNAHVVMTGRVDGPAYVDREAVLWVEGLVEGRLYVDGAASSNGAGGSVEARNGAVVHDPHEPADSQA